MPYTKIPPSATWNVHATTPKHERNLTIRLIHAIIAQHRPPQNRTGWQKCRSDVLYLGVLFYQDVTGCTLSALTYECTYLRTVLKRNDNSAIFFPVSGSLLYHMHARSVIGKWRRVCGRTKTQTATNRRMHLQRISFYMTGVWFKIDNCCRSPVTLPFIPLHSPSSCGSTAERENCK
jgi:hypothetical protein